MFFLSTKNRKRQKKTKKRCIFMNSIVRRDLRLDERRGVPEATQWCVAILTNRLHQLHLINFQHWGWFCPTRF
uniref:Uncharacterized protein n=1 Tax=Anguilla anguilla TaxID=7936 RepID=A0A0E9X2Z7_ANGAN